MSNIFIKPATDGAIVRQPDRDMRPLSPEGEWVVDSEFWQRRILDGDVVTTPPPAPPAGPLDLPDTTIKTKR